MATLRPGSTLRVEPDDAPPTGSAPPAWRFVVDGEDRGRIRYGEIRFDDLTLRVQRTGERSELVTGTGTPLLRFDPAGRKATTLTTAAARFRLARQRGKPLQHRWLLTQDVHGDPFLTVTRTPLGIRVRIDEETDVPAEELVLLAMGALVEVLDVEPAAAAA